jgi:hypothetical protein
LSRNARIGLVVAALAASVVAFVLLAPDDDGEETAATTQTSPATTTTAPPRPRPRPLTVVRVRDGRPVDGPVDITAEKGDRVRFAVSSNVEDEVHVHGYDLTKTVPAGGRTTFSLRARLEGVFEVEAHSTHEQIAALKVRP